jgi:hypothetical protein
MRLHPFFVLVLGTICFGGGCNMNTGTSSYAASDSCPSDPPHGRYTATWIPAHEQCTSWDDTGYSRSALGQPSYDAGTGSSGWGSGSSGWGSSYSSSSGCSSARCTQYEEVPGHTECNLACDAEATNCGTCVLLGTDPQHCGSCTRTCKACFDGSCQPVRDLIEAQDKIKFIAVVGGAVYWSQTRAIGRAPIVFPWLQAFLSTAKIAGGPIADDAGVYWTEMTGPELRVVAHVDGATDRVLARRTSPAREEIQRIAVDDAFVYFTDEDDAPSGDGSSPEGARSLAQNAVGLFAVEKETGAIRRLAWMSKRSDVVTGGSWTYFIDAALPMGHLRRVHPWGGSVGDLADACPVRLLGADADAVYYDNGSNIVRQPHAGGDGQPIAPSGAFTSDDVAFYSTSVMEILRTPRAGGSVVALAGLQSPTELAVSGDDLFWANGTRIRMAKTTLP